MSTNLKKKVGNGDFMLSFAIKNSVFTFNHMEFLTTASEKFLKTRPHYIMYPLVTLFITPTLLADDAAGLKKAASLELSQRNMDTVESRKIAVVGDAAYEAGEYQEAYDSYTRAVTMLPKANVTREFAIALRERRTKAAVELSKVLNRQGKVKEASELLTGLMGSSEYENFPNLAIADKQTHDPIRTNPSLSGEHTKNVEKVKHNLYKAQGAYSSGQFDLAKESYDEILRIDPYNSAARRGLSKVSKEESAYGRSAYDETRTKLLTDTGLAWEISPEVDLATDSILSDDYVAGDTRPLLEENTVFGNKFKDIIIPRYDVEDVSIIEAINLFKLMVRDNDIEPDPDKKGINIVLNLGNELNEEGNAIDSKRISLNLGTMPADKLLDLICKQAGCEWAADQYAVTIIPRGQVINQLFLRRFNVPPLFMREPLKPRESNQIEFTNLGEGGASRETLSVQSYLESAGITFAEGASASYSKTMGVLSLVNTELNMRKVDQLIDDLKKAQEVQVNIQVKVIDVLETDMNELGYDWILGSNQLSSSTYLGGGSTGNGTELSPVAVGTSSTSVGGQGITSGLRSGSIAFPSDTIDSRIADAVNSNSQTIASGTQAPGVLVGTFFANDTSLQGILRGLAQKKNSSSMWSSGLTTGSGERARIEQVRLFPYPTEYDPPELPTSIGGTTTTDSGITIVPVTPATPSAIEEKAVGRVIDIEPIIAPDRKTIAIKVEPLFNEFVGFVNYGSPITGISSTGTQVEITENAILQPIFEKVTASTNITLYDGASMVIGGLQSVEVSDVEDSVPILSDLPFVGRFFQSNGRQSIRRAVLIVVKAEIVDPLGRPYRNL